MHPVVCHLRKDIIWDSHTTNNQKESKQHNLYSEKRSQQAVTPQHNITTIVEQQTTYVM
jgi:hypothetical protein